MPKKLETMLKREVSKRKREGRPVDNPSAYVYGTMRNQGWKPDREKKGRKK